MELLHPSKMSTIDFSLGLTNREKVPIPQILSLPHLSFKGISPTDQNTDGKAHTGTAFKLLDIIVQST